MATPVCQCRQRHIPGRQPRASGYRSPELLGVSPPDFHQAGASAVGVDVNLFWLGHYSGLQVGSIDMKA